MSISTFLEACGFSPALDQDFLTTQIYHPTKLSLFKAPWLWVNTCTPLPSVYALKCLNYNTIGYCSKNNLTFVAIVKDEATYSLKDSTRQMLRQMGSHIAGWLSSCVVWLPW